jgi:catechol 2,3-dioxygenase-like lactoylglutathione lyase family enzyme
VSGFGHPAPVFAVRDLDAASAFYERLGFAVRRYDAGYGYAERDGLRIHLRGSPELEGPFSNYSEVYVETADVDRLHEEWQSRGLLQVRGAIDEELKEEVRRRWHAGSPVGLIGERVEDKPWGVREFGIRDLDNNHLRFGRQLSQPPPPVSDTGPRRPPPHSHDSV